MGLRVFAFAWIQLFTQRLNWTADATNGGRVARGLEAGGCQTCLFSGMKEMCKLFPSGISNMPCRNSEGAIQVTCQPNSSDPAAGVVSYEGQCAGPEAWSTTPFSCLLGQRCLITVPGENFAASNNYLVVSKQCHGPRSEFEESIILEVSPIHLSPILQNLHFTPTYTISGDNWLCWINSTDSGQAYGVGKLRVGPSFTRSCTLGVPCLIITRMQDANFIVSGLGGVVSIVRWEAESACTDFVDLGFAWSDTWVQLEQYAVRDRPHPLSGEYAVFGNASRRELIGDHYMVCWKKRVTPVIGGPFQVFGPGIDVVLESCTLGVLCNITVRGHGLGQVKDGLFLCNESREGAVVGQCVSGSPLGSSAFCGLVLADHSLAGNKYALCWQSGYDDSSPLLIGTVAVVDDCPVPGDSWPTEDVTITLPAGKTQLNLYVTQDCKEGRLCTNCLPASTLGVALPTFGYFAMTEDDFTTRACSGRITCEAQSCMVRLRGPGRATSGDVLVANATVGGVYSCLHEVRITTIAFGCQSGAVLSFMIVVSLVLLVTVLVGVVLEMIVRSYTYSSLEGSIELTCTAHEQPSVAALQRCVAQGVAPSCIQQFTVWSARDRITIQFQLPSGAKPVRCWATELPGLCRVEAASLREVNTPGRLPGAGLLELMEVAAARCVRGGSEAEERQLHLDFAEVMLQKLREPSVQAALITQYSVTVIVAIALPIIANFMMDDCADGYPLSLHCVWACLLFANLFFQYRLLSDSCPDRVLFRRFIRRFCVRLFVGWWIGVVSQTDMYMDLTFPVIARRCDFELWIVAAWLCALGIGIGQIGQSILVMSSGWRRARRAISPEARERAELSMLFFLLRVSDNVAVCFAVRPLLDQRLGGSSSWAAKIAEARVPAARFLFEDMEQSALQFVFLIFFEVTTAKDVVWICLSIATSFFLSLILMVQVLPEVRDWLWYRILAVVRRRLRVPLLFLVFAVYRLVASAPWVMVCSKFVADTSMLGLEVRGQVLAEVIGGCAVALVSLAMCCSGIAYLWSRQRQQQVFFQPPVYDKDARLRPKAFGAWSTEQDKWLEQLRALWSQEADSNRRTSLEQLDHNLFNLQYSHGEDPQAMQALQSMSVPDSMAPWVSRVTSLTLLRQGVQRLLVNRRFTQANLLQKSEMIASMTRSELSRYGNADDDLDGASNLLRVLPNRVLKDGIPRSDKGLTVSVAEAVEEARPRRVVLLFVSHCWLRVETSPPHPDNETNAKANALLEFSQWYCSFWGGEIEPFFWIDYSCLDQDKRDVGVALLPAFIASCAAVVLWHTPNLNACAWTNLERVLSYSYCDGGLTPYVIDERFKNDNQTPHCNPEKLPDPRLNGETTLVTSSLDEQLVQQLLNCVFAVPAFEIFPDRQTVAFGETEVVHFDLTDRTPLRSQDSVSDGFLAGFDDRAWILPADIPAPVSLGVRVLTKAQAELLMPADAARLFVPVVCAPRAAANPVEEKTVSTLVAKVDDLLKTSASLAESDVAQLLVVLQEHLEAAIEAQDEDRLQELINIVHHFDVLPPAAEEAKRQLCRSRLSAALQGSDRVLHHALLVAQLFGVDTFDFPEFKSAAEEQERRRLGQLQEQLRRQVVVAEESEDLPLLFAVRQAAAKMESHALDDPFSSIAKKAQDRSEQIISSRSAAARNRKDEAEMLSVLEIAKQCSLLQVPEAAALCEHVGKMHLDVERLQDAIGLGDDAAMVNVCKQSVKQGAAVWILRPLILETFAWAQDKGVSECQRALRSAALLGLSEDDPDFQRMVNQLHQKMGLPRDWDVVQKQWNSKNMLQRQPVMQTGLQNAIQDLFDLSIVSSAAARTSDRVGRVPTRLLVRRVIHVQHPENYLRYTASRSALQEYLREQQSNQQGGQEFQILQDVKTAATATIHLPTLLGDRGLDATCNEVLLMHGSTHKSVDKITKDGFRIDLAGTRTGAMFGQGAYFAERCFKSDEYAACIHGATDTNCCNGERPMLLCRVLLGKYKYTDEIRPNARELENACLYGGYDSVLADREAANIKRGRPPTYREFVIFDRDQVYPEYIVWYTRSFDSAFDVEV